DHVAFRERRRAAIQNCDRDSEQRHSRQAEYKFHPVYDPGMPPIGINSQAGSSASPRLNRTEYVRTRMAILPRLRKSDDPGGFRSQMHLWRTTLAVEA